MSNANMKEYIYNNPFILGQMLGYNKLTKDHNDWIKYCWLSPDDVTLQAYRNSKKTTAILVVGIIWHLMFHPENVISIIRKSEAGAMSILAEITKHYEGEKIKYIYDKYFDYKFELKDYSQRKLNIPNKARITKEDSINIFGKGGNITGFHYNIICIDDIVTEKDRYSRAERESTKNYVRELQNIKTSDGKIIATGTPWHIDDAFNIKDNILPPAKKFPIGSISDPDFTPEVIKDLEARLGTSLFAANYLLKHIADKDRLFSDIRFKTWNKGIPSYAFVDPAYSGKDTTALTLLQEINGEYIIKGFAWRENVTDLYDKIVTICDNHNCLLLRVESNADKELSLKEFKNRFPLSQGVWSSDNKHYRIVHYIRNLYDKISFDDSFETDAQSEYLEQINYYEEGATKDDAPDSLACLIREMNLVEKNVTISDSIHIVEMEDNYNYI